MPDFERLLSSSDEHIYSQLARSPGESAINDSPSGAAAGYNWWQSQSAKFQKSICAIPGLIVIADAATIAATIFEALKDSIDEHRAAYIAVLAVKTGLTTFCKSEWDSKKKE